MAEEPMFDYWRGRVDELCHFLATAYRVEDGQAVEILLSSLIACLRVSPLWMILECNWYSRHCAPAWFSFGETWVPESLPLLRTMRSRDANRLIASWLLDQSSHLLV